MFLRSCLRVMFSYMYEWFFVSLMVGKVWHAAKLENQPQKPSKSIRRQCLKVSLPPLPAIFFFRRGAKREPNESAGCTCQSKRVLTNGASQNLEGTGANRKSRIYLMQSKDTRVTSGKFRTSTRVESAGVSSTCQVQTGFLADW